MMWWIQSEDWYLIIYNRNKFIDREETRYIKKLKNETEPISPTVTVLRSVACVIVLTFPAKSVMVTSKGAMSRLTGFEAFTRAVTGIEACQRSSDNCTNVEFKLWTVTDILCNRSLASILKKSVSWRLARRALKVWSDRMVRLEAAGKVVSMYRDTIYGSVLGFPADATTDSNERWRPQ